MLPTVLRRISGNLMTLKECGDVLGTFHSFIDQFSVIEVEPERITIFRANYGLGSCTVTFMPAPEDPETWALLCREADKVIDEQLRHHAS